VLPFHVRNDVRRLNVPGHDQDEDPEDRPVLDSIVQFDRLVVEFDLLLLGEFGIL